MLASTTAGVPQYRILVAFQSGFAVVKHPCPPGGSCAAIILDVLNAPSATSIARAKQRKKTILRSQFQRAQVRMARRTSPQTVETRAIPGWKGNGLVQLGWKRRGEETHDDEVVLDAVLVAHSARKEKRSGRGELGFAEVARSAPHIVAPAAPGNQPPYIRKTSAKRLTD